MEYINKKIKKQRCNTGSPISGSENGCAVSPFVGSIVGKGVGNDVGGGEIGRGV